MGILGTLKMWPPTAQSTLHLPNQTIKRALQFTMRYIVWYYAHTFLSLLIIQSTYFTLYFTFSIMLSSAFSSAKEHTTQKSSAFPRNNGFHKLLKLQSFCE